MKPDRERETDKKVICERKNTRHGVIEWTKGWKYRREILPNFRDSERFGEAPPPPQLSNARMPRCQRQQQTEAAVRGWNPGSGGWGREVGGWGGRDSISSPLTKVLRDISGDDLITSSACSG